MGTWTAICGEYQQLLDELTTAVQLCAEFDSPIVLPIDSRKLPSVRAEQLRDAAAAQKHRAETRVFIHRATCLLCLHLP
jgi:hypothetical protein